MVVFINLMHLLFVNSEVRKKHRSLSSYTRLLALIQAQRENCYFWLLEKVGVEDISMVASNKDTRVYLIKGQSTLIDLFLLQCNNSGKFCTLETDLEKFPQYASILLQS